MIDYFLKHRIVRFGLTGGFATLIHLFVAFSVLYFLSLPVWFANFLGFICAFSFSYLMQTCFVFQKRFHLKNFIKFFIVQFSALVCAQLLSEIFSEMNHYLRVVIVVFLIPMITYMVHRLWTFKEQIEMNAWKNNE